MVTLRFNNPIIENEVSPEQAFPENPTPGQKQFIDEMDSPQFTLILWAGARLLGTAECPCGQLWNGYGMQFLLGFNPSNPDQPILDGNGGLVRGKGEMVAALGSSPGDFFAVSTTFGDGDGVDENNDPVLLYEPETPYADLSFALPVASPSAIGVPLYVQAMIIQHNLPERYDPYIDWFGLTESVEIILGAPQAP